MEVRIHVREAGTYCILVVMKINNLPPKLGSGFVKKSVTECSVGESYLYKYKQCKYLKRQRCGLKLHDLDLSQTQVPHLMTLDSS